MKIVEVDLIPGVESVKDVPLDDLMKVYKVCLEMQELCEKNEGIGLSAVQVGIPWKLFIVKADSSSVFSNFGKYDYFVNCDYKPTNNTKRIVSLEGCLSLRSKDDRLRRFQVERFDNINILGFKFTLDNFNFVYFETSIDASRQGVVFQHEIDHQLGVLISDDLVNEVKTEEILIW